MSQNIKQKRTIATLFGIVASIGLVYAQSLSSNLSRGSYGAAEIVAALFGPFFGALLNPPQGLLFESILLFFIIFSAVYMSVKQIKLFDGNKAIVTIVTLSVTILSARLIHIDLLFSVLIPYEVLGIVLSSFLPLLLAFFFTKQFENGILRKTFWIFFTVVFFAVWDARYYDAGPAGWIYFWTAIISLLMFWFDGTIRRAMIKEQFNLVTIDHAHQRAAEFREQIEENDRHLKEGRMSNEQHAKIDRKLKKHLNKLAKY